MRCLGIVCLAAVVKECVVFVDCDEDDCDELVLCFLALENE